jgi:hypothetical protein
VSYRPAEHWQLPTPPRQLLLTAPAQ